MRIFKSNKGMSLVEIIVALAILGLVSTGIIGLFTNSFKFQKRSQDAVVAQKTAESILEQLKNNQTGSFSGINYAGEILSMDGSDGDFDEEGNFVVEESKIQGDKYFSIEWEKPTNVIRDAEGNPILALYQVTVTVYDPNNDSIIGTATGSITIEGKANIKGTGSRITLDAGENGTLIWTDNNGIENGGIRTVSFNGEKSKTYLEAFEEAGYGSEFPVAAKENAEFYCWKDSGTGEEIDPEIDTIDGGKTLVAQYISNYKVTLNLNGGEWKAHNFNQKLNIYLASEATCEAEATYYYSCSDCGAKGTETYEYGSINSNNHAYSDTYTTNANDHWKLCTRVGCTSTTSLVAHTGGTATCKEKPVCTTCNTSYGSKSSKHNYESKLLGYSRCDSCKKELASYRYTCTICGYSKTEHTDCTCESESGGTTGGGTTGGGTTGGGTTAVGHSHNYTANTKGSQQCPECKNSYSVTIYTCSCGDAYAEGSCTYC